MRYVITILFFLVSAIEAYPESRGITPYGDYCQWCSEYGTCKENVDPKKAEKAIERYFAGKGLKASNMRHRERFIEAEIYRNSNLVDRVLFDRKTGRIRSTY